jgi:hypothetical protein
MPFTIMSLLENFAFIKKVVWAILECSIGVGHLKDFAQKAILSLFDLLAQATLA